MDEIVTIPISAQTQVRLKAAGVDNLDTLAHHLIDLISSQDDETQKRILSETPPANGDGLTVYTETFLR